MSKSEFIRKFPFTMPAADVVAEAKKKGIKISKGLVSVVRTADRKRAREQGKPVPPGGRIKSTPPAAVPTATIAGLPSEERLPDLKVVRKVRANEHDHALRINGFQVRSAEERELCELSLQVGFTRAAEVLNGFRVRCLQGLKD